MKKIFALILVFAFLALSSTAEAVEESRVEIHSITFFLNSTEVIVRVDYSLESLTEFSVKLFGDAPIKREIQNLFDGENIEFLSVSESEAFLKFGVHQSVLEPVRFDREIKNVSFVFSDGTTITVHNRTVTPRVFF